MAYTSFLMTWLRFSSILNQPSRAVEKIKKCAMKTECQIETKRDDHIDRTQIETKISEMTTIQC